MDTYGLKGRVAIVTGAAHGIGNQIALNLSEHGVYIAANDIPGNSKTLELIEDIEKKGGNAISIAADVKNCLDVEACVNYVFKKWGRIDILINNAGIVKNSMIMRISESEWDELIDVNLKGAFLFSKYAVRYMMMQRWGRIINIASVSGIVGSLGRVHYAASKGGLIAFTRTLASEVGSKNITVNSVAPGFITSGLSENISKEAKEYMLSRTVLNRFGTAREVADLVLFLSSEKCGYITGQVIGIDGGIT